MPPHTALGPPGQAPKGRRLTPLPDLFKNPDCPGQDAARAPAVDAAATRTARPGASLPRYVRVGRNDRGAVVHCDGDGVWHANIWSGPIGAFATCEDALKAIRKAPPRPKPEKKLAGQKPDPSAYGLAAASGKHVYDGPKRTGAVYLVEGQFAAWDTRREASRQVRQRQLRRGRCARQPNSP